MGQPTFEPAHAHGRQRPFHAVMDLGLRHAHVERPEGHVLEDGGAEELVVRVLEDEANLGADPLHALPIDEHSADPHGAVGGGVDPVEVEHEGALAGAVRADERHLLAPRDPQVDAPQGLEAVRVDEVQVLQLHPAGGDVVRRDPFARRTHALGDVELVGRMLMHVEVRVRGRVLVRMLVRVRMGVRVGRGGRGVAAGGGRGGDHVAGSSVHGRGRISWPATTNATIAAATIANAVQSVAVRARPPIERNSPSKPRACMAA